MRGFAGHVGPSDTPARDLLAALGGAGGGGSAGGAAPATRTADRVGLLQHPGTPGGDAPVTSDSGRWVLAGEAELSDTRPRGGLAAVAARLDADGADALAALAGTFALAAYDTQEQTLHLVRDPLGIAPLHLTRVGGATLFASTIRPLLAAPGVVPDAEVGVVARYLLDGTTEAGAKTFFAGIERVLPGESVVVTGAGTERRQLHDAEQDLARIADEAVPFDGGAVAATTSALFDAVRDAVGPGVTGTSLSGGLDSAAIAAVLSRLVADDPAVGADVGPRQNVVTAGFSGTGHDETAELDGLIAAFSDRWAPHRAYPTPDRLRSELSDLIRTLEEPVSSLAPYAEFCVLREAAGSVEVLLDGVGADQLLAGDPAHARVARREALATGTSPAVRARALAGLAADRVRTGPAPSGARRLGRSAFSVASVLRPGVAARAEPAENVVEKNLAARLRQDLLRTVLPERLRSRDRAARRFGVLPRSPFLDPALVEHLAGLDSAALIGDGHTERVLREAVRGIVPEAARTRRGSLPFSPPQEEWFKRLKGTFYAVFRAPSFGTRPWFDQRRVLDAYEAWVAGRTAATSAPFWRLVNVELWAREFLDAAAGTASAGGANADDPYGEHDEPDAKDPLAANGGKELDLTLPDGTIARRYPVQTAKFTRDTEMAPTLARYVTGFFDALAEHGDEDDRGATEGRPWNLVVSEKIIAIMQGRSYFIWDVKTGFWARTLSKQVSRTPAGIGLGDPVTMQLAIQEAGLLRVLAASVAGAAGKLVGRRGLFYEVVGGHIRAIDGPTEYSVYPANVSAKLAPKDPDRVAAQLRDALRPLVPERFRDTFQGVVVMDANDIGRNCLGKAAPRSAEHYEEQFRDNPLGQGRDQTPMAIVFERAKGA